LQPAEHLRRARKAPHNRQLAAGSNRLPVHFSLHLIPATKISKQKTEKGFYLETF
jgi:hypothetical protein